MNILNSVKHNRNRMLITAATLGVASSIGLAAAFSASAQAVTFNSATDCDNNAVIYCGAHNTNELIDKYHANASSQVIYDYFGITKQAIESMDANVQAGQVAKNGDVTVGGKVVATNALTAGRYTMKGSTAVTKNGVTFYTRTPSVSFLSNSLDAFVVMVNGEFKFAIISACGNPVIAQPVKPPTPPPAPAKPVTPVVTPPQPKKPETPPAPQPVPPAPAPVPAPPELPKTGMGSEVAGMFVAISGTGAAAHQVFVRRRHGQR